MLVGAWRTLVEACGVGGTVGDRLEAGPCVLEGGEGEWLLSDLPSVPSRAWSGVLTSLVDKAF